LQREIHEVFYVLAYSHSVRYFYDTANVNKNISFTKLFCIKGIGNGKFAEWNQQISVKFAEWNPQILAKNVEWNPQFLTKIVDCIPHFLYICGGKQ
jgi:hypothetical protein